MTVDPIDPIELSIHKLYRERLVQEDNLINHRMTWMFASQSIILVLWGALYKVNGQINPLSNILDIIGFAFAWGSRISIRAAQDEIDLLNDKYQYFYKSTERVSVSNEFSEIPVLFDKKNPIIPSIVGSKKLHWQGHIIPTFVPKILRVLWLIIFVFSVSYLLIHNFKISQIFSVNCIAGRETATVAAQPIVTDGNAFTSPQPHGAGTPNNPNSQRAVATVAPAPVAATPQKEAKRKP